MQIPKIITKHLILRSFQNEDLNTYAQICADPETMQYIGTGKPYLGHTSVSIIMKSDFDD